LRKKRENKNEQVIKERRKIGEKYDRNKNCFTGEK